MLNRLCNVTPTKGSFRLHSNQQMKWSKVLANNLREHSKFNNCWKAAYEPRRRSCNVPSSCWVSLASVSANSKKLFRRSRHEIHREKTGGKALNQRHRDRSSEVEVHWREARSPHVCSTVGELTLRLLFRLRASYLCVPNSSGMTTQDHW